MKWFVLSVVCLFLLAACAKEELPPNPPAPGGDATVGRALGGLAIDPSRLPSWAAQLKYTDVTPVNVTPGGSVKVTVAKPSGMTNRFLAYSSMYVFNKKYNFWEKVNADTSLSGSITGGWAENSAVFNFTVSTDRFAPGINYFISYWCIDTGNRDSQGYKIWDCNNRKWGLGAFELSVARYPDKLIENDIGTNRYLGSARVSDPWGTEYVASYRDTNNVEVNVSVLSLNNVTAFKQELAKYLPGMINSSANRSNVCGFLQAFTGVTYFSWMNSSYWVTVATFANSIDDSKINAYRARYPSDCNLLNELKTINVTNVTVPAAMCGNSVLEGSEQCDPPGSATCPGGGVCRLNCTCAPVAAPAVCPAKNCTAVTNIPMGANTGYENQSAGPFYVLGTRYPAFDTSTTKCGDVCVQDVIDQGAVDFDGSNASVAGICYDYQTPITMMGQTFGTRQIVGVKSYCASSSVLKEPVVMNVPLAGVTCYETTVQCQTDTCQDTSTGAVCTPAPVTVTPVAAAPQYVWLSQYCTQPNCPTTQCAPGAGGGSACTVSQVNSSCYTSTSLSALGQTVTMYFNVTCLPAPVCGNGIAEIGEQCGEPGINYCTSNQVCQNCTCVQAAAPAAPPQFAGKITTCSLDRGTSVYYSTPAWTSQGQCVYGTCPTAQCDASVDARVPCSAAQFNSTCYKPIGSVYYKFTCIQGATCTPASCPSGMTDLGVIDEYNYGYFDNIAHNWYNGYRVCQLGSVQGEIVSCLGSCTLPSCSKGTLQAELSEYDQNAAYAKYGICSNVAISLASCQQSTKGRTCITTQPANKIPFENYLTDLNYISSASRTFTYWDFYGAVPTTAAAAPTTTTTPPSTTTTTAAPPSPYQWVSQGTCTSPGCPTASCSFSIPLSNVSCTSAQVGSDCTSSFSISTPMGSVTSTSKYTCMRLYSNSTSTLSEPSFVYVPRTEPITGLAYVAAEPQSRGVQIALTVIAALGILLITLLNLLHKDEDQ